MTHEEVHHPRELLEEAAACRSWLLRANDAVLAWITERVLGSVIAFDVALVVPLLLWNAPENVKLLLALFSGSWLQWWALHALQRYQGKTQAAVDAKAEVDHRTLTYLAKLQDEQMDELKLQTEILNALKGGES